MTIKLIHFDAKKLNLIHLKFYFWAPCDLIIIILVADSLLIDNLKYSRVYLVGRVLTILKVLSHEKYLTALEKSVMV